MRWAQVYAHMHQERWHIPLKKASACFLMALSYIQGHGRQAHASHCISMLTSNQPSTLPPAALLIFIHGFSDHINAYYNLFPTLALRGIQTFGVDQRGWGRSVHSASERGLTGPTSIVLADINSIVEDQLKKNVDGVPVFLMGHSMGGAQVLHYAAQGPADVKRKISGFLAESPFIAIHKDSQPARFTVVAGRLAARVLPRRQMVQKLDPNMMSRDPEVCKQYHADDLCHDTGTLEGLAGMLRRAEQLETGAVTPKDEDGIRVWVGHGSGDKVCSFEATQKFMDRLEVKDKEFRIYDGWFHKRKFAKF